MKTAYLNMLVTSIPTNITFTGNQTLINFHVSGSVETKPRRLNIETITTEMKFCIHININNYIIMLERPTHKRGKYLRETYYLVQHQGYPSIKIIAGKYKLVNQYHATG